MSSNMHFPRQTSVSDLSNTQQRHDHCDNHFNAASSARITLNYSSGITRSPRDLPSLDGAD